MENDLYSLYSISWTEPFFFCSMQIGTDVKIDFLLAEIRKPMFFNVLIKSKYRGAVKRPRVRWEQMKEMQ